MSRTFAFRCNLPKGRARKIDPLLLSTFGMERNVDVRIEQVSKIFQRNLDGRIADALDIAAFVYAADSSISRDRSYRESAELEAWSRMFLLEIGVRDVAFWRRPDIISKLKRIIEFLSDDKYDFTFYPLQDDRAKQDYLELGDSDTWPFTEPARVTLFSGGLDSLAGAAEYAAKGENLVLLSHRSAAKVASRQAKLVTAFRGTYPKIKVLAIPVWVQRLAKPSTRQVQEYTQRTRSLLFWGLGLAVGSSLRAGGLRFLENGIVSLNLPVADQVLRARASRTTHPFALRLMEELSALILDRPFVVENPYLLLTKEDVVRRAVEAGAKDLIQLSCSCAHTHMQRANQWHCGCCSQCIDRRIAVLAAGAERFDPEEDYRVDVFTGARSDVRDQTMACNYIRHALELNRASAEEINIQFNGQIARAVRPFPNKASAAEGLIGLHKRHGAAVMRVMRDVMGRKLNDLISGEIEPTSLLGLTGRGEHLRKAWLPFAERLTNILREGLLRACHSVKPHDEPGLQEICDGLLAGADEKLVREYPFLRWGSRMTKPDWSAEDILIWVELKYIRKRSDIRPITDAISADITKYGDSGRRTIFIVYDPYSHLIDRQGFMADIEQHGESLARIIG